MQGGFYNSCTIVEESEIVKDPVYIKSQLYESFSDFAVQILNYLIKPGPI